MKKIVLVGVVCTVFTGQIQASSELEILVEMLRANGTVSEDQYKRLTKELKNTAQEKKNPKKRRENKSTVTVNLNSGGLRLKTTDDEFSVRIGGRLQIDSAWYDDDGSDMGNGTELRRARLYILGKMFTNWGYKLQYDFTGSGKAGIKDAFLTYNGFEHVQLKAGNFKDPFMLQEQTSSKYITFTERALLDAFSSGRHLGVMASTKHKKWTAAIGFFGDSVSASAKGKDEGWGVGGRLTYSPFNQKSRVVHLGVAGNYRGTGNIDTVRFKQQPETHISGVDIVDTGIITSVDNYLKLGAELAAVEGPLSIQSEYIWTTVERKGEGDLDFDGWYAEAAYFLTGESRNYKKGKFGGISPKGVVGRGGFGAWQIAARYSSIDLNNAEIDGGQADNFTIGLNWFPTSTLRFSGNYVRVLDIEGGMYHDEEPSVFQLRGQWAF